MPPSVTFHKVKTSLILQYTSGQDIDWIEQILDKNEIVKISKVFFFQAENRFKGSYKLIEPFLSPPENTITFVFGNLQEDYYRVPRQLLTIKHDLFIHKDIKINYKLFVAQRGISIFGKIDQISDEPIIIGGELDNAIPVNDFLKLIASFPNSIELDRYSHSVISRNLRQYLSSMTDGEQRFELYLNRNRRRKSISGGSGVRKKIEEQIEVRNKVWFEFEAKKYEYIRDEIKLMLSQHQAYSEKEWQKIILDFILLIFPKYILCIEEFKVNDFYFKPDFRPTSRSIDFALIDASGNLDIIEIKQPFKESLLSKTRPRDNYVPHRELSQTIMQVEKYLFHLTKWGIDGESEVNKKYRKRLPEGLSINLVNPKGILILGRSNEFDKDQRFDFEIIKRKYSNIVDIITYDDLLHRLDNIIKMFSEKSQ